MRRLSRLDRSLDLLRPRPSASLSPSSLCLSCRRQAPFSTALRMLAKPDAVPLTSKLRKKIWGTEDPPGLEDPYGGPSFADKRKAERAAERKKAGIEEVDEVEAVAQKKGVIELDASYEPATTWDGLEEVGGIQQEEEVYFEGFLPAERVSDPWEATAALHRAVVEVFTLKGAGHHFSELSDAGRESDQTVPVQISLPTSATSPPVLHFPEGSSKEMILQSLMQPETDGFEDQVTESVELGDLIKPALRGAADSKGPNIKEYSAEGFNVSQIRQHQEDVASWDPIWLQISLNDPEIKFAIVKRVLQLTGIRIPDSAINSSHKVQSLLNHLTTKPKPAKLAEALAQKGNLVSLPNVRIFDRRITPIDKEKSVGRWKVIEKELLRRDLPVTGH